MENIFQFIDVLPEVNLDRNDTEQQIFTKYFNTINQNMLKEILNLKPEIMKNIELSEKCRMKGNLHYRAKNYTVAMTFYVIGLRQAPRDSTEYALTIANRSAECLVDIERVFKSEYPKDMLYKIYMRQAKCYLELKCYGKASKAAQNAKTSFETAKVTLNKKVSELIAEKIKDIERCLENHLDTDTTVNDEEQPSFPVLTAGENPSFAYASNAVAMRKNKQSGRHVVASVDIKKGDVLFVEEPYSTDVLLFSETYFKYCSECFTSSLTCIPCTSCFMLVFCSDECRQLHWDTRHRWECAAVRRSVISKELSLALGVLFRVSHTGFNTIIPDARVYGNKTDNYPYVNQLMTHKNNIPQETYTGYVKAAACLVVYLIHFTDYFEWLYARYNRPAGSREELHRMVGGLLLKFLSQNGTNKDIINNTFVARADKYDIGLKRNQLACALYVSSSALNHACLPNTVKRSVCIL
ncbi:SET and MYND domain containing class 4 member 3 [Carabus blaptoides fortunei]